MNNAELDLLFAPPLDRLATYDDRSATYRWHEGDPDYVTELVLGPEHIPSLTRIATLWYEPGDPIADTAWDPAPRHAWRALGQLRAEAAIEPLLSITNRIDEEMGDAHLEEFPKVYGLIGPPAIPALIAYLRHPGNRDFARASAASGLAKIAQRFPEARVEVVTILTELLTDSGGQSEALNASLVSHLLDLNAVESAEVIERAYAAKHVDETHCGYWGDVRKELGVQGLALAPEGRTADRVSGFDQLRDNFQKAIVNALNEKYAVPAPEDVARRKAIEKNARKRARRKLRGK